MSSAPSHPQLGTILHRLCPQCDLEILEDRTHCAECGSKLVEIRDEIDTLVGTIVDGRFEIRAKLGQGGMGTVYRAWQKSVGREIAVKLIDRSFSRDAMAVRRFLREARLASQLSQPNTVSVFDFGQIEDGRLFIAMELIRGRTLHQVIQSDGTFSIERTVRIGVQICDALEAAHGLGIIHRDLKLENVIVLDHPPGRDLLKVLDFGLAKNIHEPGSRATESGIVVGTPRYMSPEASTAGITGSAGDVYSLGVILGELSTGKPLWKGESLPELITQKLDPKSVIERIPVPLRPLLEKVLHPDPDKRPTAEQMRTLLAAITPSSENRTQPATKSSPGAQATPAPEATRPLTPSGLATAPTFTPIPVIVSAPVAAPPSGAPLGAPTTEKDLQPRRTRRWPLALVGAGVLAAAAVVVVVATGGNGTSGAARPAPPSGSATTAVAPPADAAAVAELPVDAPMATAPLTVKVHIDSDPRGATVTLAGQSKVAPCDFDVDRGSAPIELRATAAGRKPQKLSIVPDGDKTETVKLAPRSAASSDDQVPF